LLIEDKVNRKENNTGLDSNEIVKIISVDRNRLKTLTQPNLLSDKKESVGDQSILGSSDNGRWLGVGKRASRACIHPNGGDPTQTPA